MRQNPYSWPLRGIESRHVLPAQLGHMVIYGWNQQPGHFGIISLLPSISVLLAFRRLWRLCPPFAWIKFRAAKPFLTRTFVRWLRLSRSLGHELPQISNSLGPSSSSWQRQLWVNPSFQNEPGSVRFFSHPSACSQLGDWGLNGPTSVWGYDPKPPVKEQNDSVIRSSAALHGTQMSPSFNGCHIAHQNRFCFPAATS